MSRDVVGFAKVMTIGPGVEGDHGTIRDGIKVVDMRVGSELDIAIGAEGVLGSA